MTMLALLHTSQVVIRPINDLARTLMPRVALMNLLDDGILGQIARTSGVDAVRRRVERLAQCATDANADALLITCSSISELAASAAKASGLPVYTIDEAMAEEAVRRGTRIGVLATVATTLDPTCRLIERKAKEAGKRITIRRALADDAFAELSRGNANAHDEILHNALVTLAATEGVIVLAQASMARLIDGLGEQRIPILASPRLGLERVRAQLQARGLAAD
ncbi:MAG TPA: aspartate/glutamate racemase family protein [Casimicrobiaceae bacterium]|nr:aspartate/glutamate racemase family protein [Casimicrobiaceae bacterium]